PPDVAGAPPSFRAARRTGARGEAADAARSAARALNGFAPVDSVPDHPIEARRRRARMEQARVIAASRRMFIDGEWVEASTGATYEVPNPATEAPVGSAPDATVEDMRRAIAAARRAFDEGPWPTSSRHDRARVLHAIADGIERRKEEMRQLLIAEAG